MRDSQRTTEKVRSIAQMGRPELVSEWQTQFGAPPPPKLRVELMRPVLVYLIQENTFGPSGLRRKGRIQDFLQTQIIAASRRGRRLSGSGKANFTRLRSRLRTIYITVRHTKVSRRSPFGSLEPNGRAQPSSAPSLRKALDDGTTVQRKMRDLYAQIFRRGAGSSLQFSARPTPSL
jgi:hypothetical protein